MGHKPLDFPRTQANGAPLKPITEALLDRRATTHFTREEVPEEFLNAILKLGTQAPTGYNLQPWRFIVVRNEENRRRLQQAAFGQEKVVEAPVIVIAIGLREDWDQKAEEVLREGVQRGAGKVEELETQKQEALEFLSNIRKDVWLNRHIMVGRDHNDASGRSLWIRHSTHGRLDPVKVKQEFGIPEEAEVVALLAIGRNRDPTNLTRAAFLLTRLSITRGMVFPGRNLRSLR